MLRTGRRFWIRFTLLIILSAAVLARAQTVQEVAEAALPATVTIEIDVYERGTGRHLGTTGGSGFLVRSGCWYEEPEGGLPPSYPFAPFWEFGIHKCHPTLAPIISRENDLAIWPVAAEYIPAGSNSHSPIDSNYYKSFSLRLPRCGAWRQIYLITNAHVIAPESPVYVKVGDSCRSVSVDYGDPRAYFPDGSRLALTEIVEVRELPELPIGRSGELQRGDEVVIVGSPLGIAGTVSSGHIANLHQTIEIWSHECDPAPRTLHDIIMIDGTTTYGNSGGAVLNMEGEVIGVAVGWITGTGFGWAIPINQATAMLPDNDPECLGGPSWWED